MVSEGVEELIGNLVEDYESRTKASKEAHGKASKHLPLGVGSNIRAYKPYPIFVRRAQGCRIWDLDENNYLDFCMGFGALMAGHSHPLLVEELADQLRDGIMHTFSHDYEAKMALELKRRFPVDMVRFSNSGNEATTHAIRLARGFTRRDVIVKLEGAYHGSTDALLVSWNPSPERAGSPEAPTPVVSSEGIPEGAWRNTLVAPFNDLDSMEALFRKRGEAVAAVILEPVMLNAGVIPPADGYLKGVEGLCREYGSLLILDEVKTGCRLAPGGATELYRLHPDVIVLGKSIGGGVPLSAFGASAEVMGLVANKRVLHAGTYNTTPLAMRCGYATLHKVLTESALRSMMGLQRVLEDGYRDLVEQHRLEAQVQTAGPMGSLLFTPEPVRNYREFLKADPRRWYAYWLGMLNKGVLAHPPGPDEQWNLCVQHTEEDVETHLQALDAVLGNIRRAS